VAGHPWKGHTLPDDHPEHAMSRRSTLTVTTLLALATTGSAFASTAAAPAFEEDPFLGRISGGAGVRYDLDRAAAKSVVTIEGRRATVKATDRKTHEYSAFVNRSGFVQGRSYRVKIKITGADGRTRTFSRSLYLHRSMNAPR